MIMMGELIQIGKPPHRCKPFMEEAWVRSPMVYNNMEPYERTPPLGTIWRCDCGRLWEVIKDTAFGGAWHHARFITRLRVWWRLRDK